MKLLNIRAWVLRAVSLSIVCLGFAQVAPAGMISTSQLVENEARAETLSRMELLLAREDVTKQMLALGVQPQQVMARLDAMTTAELIELESRFDEQVAGGDVEVDEQRIELLQWHDGRTRLQVFAEVHLANPEQAAEGRGDTLFRDLGLLGGQLCGGIVQPQPCLVVIGARYGLFLHQLLAPLELHLGQSPLVAQRMA